MNLFTKLKNAKKTLNQASKNSDLLIELDDIQIKKIQDELLEIYLDIEAACKRNNISVILSGGSALGVVRHQGFIPWDEDLDLAISRKDYNKFCQIFERELGDKYILNAPNYSRNAKARFPMVLKKDSYFESIIDVKDPDLHKLFVDIFIIENIPDNRFHRFIKGKFCELLHFISGQVYVFECRDEDMKKYFCSVGKSYYFIRMTIGFLFSFLHASKWFDLVDSLSQHDNENSKYVGTVTGRRHYFKEMMKREVWYPYSSGFFEGREVLVHHDVKEYLSNIYGDFMQVPKPEDRERHFIYKMKI